MAKAWLKTFVIGEIVEMDPSGKQRQHLLSKPRNNVNTAHPEPDDNKSLGGDKDLSTKGDSAVNDVTGCIKRGGKQATFTTAKNENNKKGEIGSDKKVSKTAYVAGELFSKVDSEEPSLVITTAVL